MSSRTVAIVVHAVVFVRVEELDEGVGRIVLLLLMEMLRLRDGPQVRRHQVRLATARRVHRDQTVVMLLEYVRLLVAAVMYQLMMLLWMMRYQVGRAVHVVAVHLQKQYQKLKCIKYLLNRHYLIKIGNHSKHLLNDTKRHSYKTSHFKTLFGYTRHYEKK